MTGIVSRSRDAATPEELGQDVLPDSDGPREPDLAHDLVQRQVPEDADRYPSYEYDECPRCGTTGRVGDLDPYEECEPHETVGAREDSMVGIPGEAGR